MLLPAGRWLPAWREGVADGAGTGPPVPCCHRDVQQRRRGLPLYRAPGCARPGRARGRHRTQGVRDGPDDEPHDVGRRPGRRRVLPLEQERQQRLGLAGGTETGWRGRGAVLGCCFPLSRHVELRVGHHGLQRRPGLGQERRHRPAGPGIDWRRDVSHRAGLVPAGCLSGPSGHGARGQQQPTACRWRWRWRRRWSRARRPDLRHRHGLHAMLGQGLQRLQGRLALCGLLGRRLRGADVPLPGDKLLCVLWVGLRGLPRQRL